MKRRVLSLILAIGMVLTMLPVNVFASDAMQEPATVFLPVTDEVVPVQPSVSQKIIIYTSTDAFRVNLPEFTLPSGVITGTNPGARIQALDTAGNVVGQTASFWVSEYDTELNSRELFFLQSLPAGNYDLQLIYGNTETVSVYKLDAVLTVVDAPVILSGSMNLAAGSASSELRLTITGYKGDPNLYSFALIDAETAETIPCSAQLSGFNQYTDSTNLKYLLTPKKSLSAAKDYVLAISVAEGKVYSSADAISSTAKDIPQAGDTGFAILEVAKDHNSANGLTLKIGGASEDTTYWVEAFMSNASSATLYSDTCSPEIEDGVGTFTIGLLFNGIPLPLSAYENNGIQIMISDDNGNYDSFYYYFDGYMSMYADLELVQNADGGYDFVLQGRNMLLDLYEQTAPLSFTLARYDSARKDYVTVSTACSAVAKTVSYENGNTIYTFSGTFTTAAPLDPSTYYYLCNGDDSLAGGKPLAASSDDDEESELFIDSFHMSQFSSKKIYFNFGYLPVEVSLGNCAGTASVSLYDITADQIVSTSAVETAVPDAYGICTFDCMIPYTEAMDASHKYSLRITSGEETMDISEYSSYYSEFGYNDTVSLPNYVNFEEPLFVGALSLQAEISAYSVKNITLDTFETMFDTMVHTPSETGLSLLDSSYAYDSESNNWVVTFRLASALKLGEYTYTFNGRNSSFTVRSADTVVLGYADYKNGELTVYENANLPEGTYTGTLYRTDSNVYEKVADLSLTRSGSDLLCASTALPEGDYALDVRVDNVYLDTVTFDVSADNEPSAPTDAIITAESYRLVQIGENAYEREWMQVEYLTESSELYMSAYLKDYGYVRFSEDNTFKGVSYQPIRNSMYFELSDGNGEKTIYVQFKKTAGEESAVYTWSCKKVDSVADPAILSVSLEIDDCEPGTTLVPKDTYFTLYLTSTSVLNNVYAEFIQSNGSSHYETFPLYLDSTDEAEDGYLYSCSLFSGDDPFYMNHYAFTEVRFCLGSLNGYEILDTKTLPISFGAEAAEGLYLDAWGDGYDLYINKTDFTVTGSTAKGAEVTLTRGDNVYTATADEKTGKFSFELTGLTEDDYRIRVKDNFGGSETCYLCVDLTAPVIDTLKAVLADNGNAAVTWSCTESNLTTFLLYRDGSLIKGKENPVYSSDKYTDTNYIAANAAGATFTVVALDRAGNRSEPKTITVGDNEAPTAPGIPTLTAHTTKSISFSWTPATDNIAVYHYEVYRGNEKLAELPYTAVSFTDSELTEDSAYTYTVYALDRAGNKSEASAAELRTASLTITDHTEWSEEDYIIEAYEERDIALEAKIGIESDYHDLSESVVVFRYAAEGSDDWTDVTMERKYSAYTANWDISNLEAGTYAVSFRVTDAEGTEKTTESRTVTLVHDTVAPEISFIRPFEDAVIGGSEVPSVSITATDNIRVKTVKIYYQTVGGEKTLLSELTNELNVVRFDRTVEFTQAAELESGLLVLTAEAYDKRENVGTATVSVMLDNTAPTTPEDFHVTSDANKISVLWNKTNQEPDFAYFNVYRSTSADGTFEKIKTTVQIGYYDDASTGIDLTGTYYYYVTSVDHLGNESAPTAVDFGQMVSDSEAPAIVDFLPKTGSTLCNKATFTVSVEDNFKLGKIKAEYYDTAESAWVSIGEKTVTTKTAVVSIDWALTDLTPGTYQVRFTAVDSVGNTSEAAAASYVIDEYVLPVSPAATVTAGHRAAELNWTYSGKASLISRFEIYRSDAEDGEYVCVGSTAKDSFTNKDLALDKTYWYKVRAVDKFDKYAESEPVSVTITLSDSKAPTACITMKDSVIALGSALNFDGSGSTDNDLIASYAWDFGDDTTGTGSICSHTFAAAGTYTVTLTVTDAAGNENSTTVSVTVVDMTKETDYLYATFTVVDGSDGTTPIHNAEIQISSEAGADVLTTVTTASDGKVTVLLKKGAYTVHTIADGHMGRTANVMITEDNSDILIGLGGSGSIKGSLTATEMTLEEIIAAGIDPNDPDNQHVYRGALVLTFTQIDKSLSFNVYYNAKGRILFGGGGGGGFGGGGGGGGGGGFGLHDRLYRSLLAEGNVQRRTRCHQRFRC